MKLFFLIVGCAVAGFGCTVSNDSSVRFVNAHPFTLGPQTAGCSPQTVGIYRGSLDLAGSNQYYVSFEWESLFQPISTTISPDTIAGPQKNDFVLDHFVFNYSSTPSLAFQTEQVDAYAILRAGASGSNSWLGISLIGPQALQVLSDHIQAGDFRGVELLVNFQAFGTLASSGPKISSNKVTYPINVYRSNFVQCRVAGDIRAPTGPCGAPGGQDGTLVGCCKDFSPVPQGCPTQ
jgi:hypothetical protein